MRPKSFVAGFVTIIAAFFGAWDFLASHDALEALQGSASRAGVLKVDDLSSDLRQGRTRIAGLSRSDGFISIRVGQLTLDSAPSLFSLFGPARAAGNSATAEDVTIETGLAAYKISRIDIKGGSLSTADLQQIFDNSSNLLLAERLGRLSAASITMPEVIETRFGAKQKIVYRDVALKGVAQGKVETVSASGASISFSSPANGDTTGAYGEISAHGLNLVLAARIMTGPRTDPEEPLGILYESFLVNGFHLSNSTAGFEVNLGELSGSGVRGRPPARSWTDLEDADVSSPAQAERIGFFLTDLLDSFEIDDFKATDLLLRFTSADNYTATITAACLAASHQVGTQIGFVELRGVAFENRAARLTFGRLGFRGGDLRELQQRLAGAAAAKEGGGAAGATPLAQIDADEIGIALLRAEPDPTGQEADRLFSAAHFELRWPDNKDAASRDIQAKLDHLQLSSGASESGLFKYLALIGYDKVDLSGQLDATWSEPNRSLEISNFLIEGARMGTAKITAKLDNVGAEILSPDPEVATAAALALTLKRFELRLDNAGLFEKIIAAEAKRQNRTADQIRQNYAAAATFLLPALLGGGPPAQTLGVALAKFVAKPQSLRVLAVAPAGFGVGDLALAKGPRAVAAKLNIEASANQ